MRTRRFSLGVPRGFVVARGSTHVLFLRSDAGDDPVTHLWRHHVADGATTRLVDARLLGVDPGAAGEEERARRERTRELADGITAFSADRDALVVAFALSGRLFTLDVASGTVRAQDAAGDGVFDPRVAPDGSAIAYHRAGGLEVLALPGGAAGPGEVVRTFVEEGVALGRAEFIAAEEMGRGRGFWWSGDARRLAVARVDERAVPRWHLADPTDPAAAVRTVAYPAAGTTNASVSLVVVSVDDGRRVDVERGEDDEYLAVVRWGEDPLTVLVQSRDQRSARVLVVDPATGRTERMHEHTDPAWVDLVPGAPAWSGDRLVTVAPDGRGDAARSRLHLDGTPVGPTALEVRGIVHVDAERAVVEVTGDDPRALWVEVVDLSAPGRTAAVGRTGGRRADRDPAIERVVLGPDGWDGAQVRLRADLTDGGTRVSVLAPRRVDVEGSRAEHELEVVAERPVVTPRPVALRLGSRRLEAALLLPADVADDERLPVLLDPYGGPHAQRVVAARNAHVTSQWFADRGFAVLVVDGRGTPGRGPAWERAVHGDLAGPALDDQVEALEAAAALDPRLDASRVGIRGWSYGGTLAALAVLRRPDVFRAAIAGAPVTDWRLYDTHYTERYLGDPGRDPDAYARSSLVDADGRLVGPADWDDPAPGLMLVHGLVDDNVVAAHALRLSRALILEGRPHRFVPLPGVTHVAGADDVAARLLELELAFLREHLGARERGA